MLGLFNLTLCKLERCLYGSLLRSLFFRESASRLFRLGSCARGFFGSGFQGKALSVLAIKF
ncbi:hypothetical protein PSYAR_15202 [Pseudomonas syringae pv. aceris str. M302273]|nr:hypothetical protein PSYAR_15202 [Pseudomonas syringae pv. aceris str. M302273]KOG02664.1 Uncharacterized protein ABJ98_1576 [Pseudomonas syringae pv. aceris]